MSQVKFQFDERDYNKSYSFRGKVYIDIIIQCNENDKMKDIFQKFYSKTEIDKNSIYYRYNEKIINEDLTLKELKQNTIENEEIIIVQKIYRVIFQFWEFKNDYKDKYGDIIIPCFGNEQMKNVIQKFCDKTNIDKNLIKFEDKYDYNKINEDLSYNELNKNYNELTIYVKKNYSENLTKSKDIICPYPFCKEYIRIEIKEFKIKLYDCKNGHKFENLSLDEFEISQLIYKSEFYNCKENSCPLEEQINNNECKKHEKENFVSYCKDCKENICSRCYPNHKNKNHIIISLGDILAEI